MAAKPVRPRALAQADIDAAAMHYLGEAGAGLALACVDSVERAFSQLGAHPGSGAGRYAHALDLPGLRFWPLRRFPYLIFYVERADHVDVWRVLHASRDVPAWLRAPDSE